MQSVMTDRFRAAADVEIPRSSFDRSHGHKTTFDAGWLIPIYVDEALPGDTFNMDLTAFVRMATPLFPLMDNLVLETFFFAVPNRLLWTNWERFCGAQDNPVDSVDFLIPQINGDGVIPVHSLGDYLGIPVGVDATGDFGNALFARAYNKIYNDWFRDQNLQNSVPVLVDDGPDPIAAYTLLRRGKRHDYFTSCLPWPQKGADVIMPLGGTAPVAGTGLAFSVTNSVDVGFMSTTIATPNIDLSLTATAGGFLRWVNPQLVADLSSATAATINDIREAFQLQKMLERDARGGTRYTEIVKAHFGVNSPDQRLQRAEYLGGGSSPVNIIPVAQTSSTDVASPQGHLAAFGTSNVQRHGFTKSFTEHSVLLGLVNVRADLTYQRGVERMWGRRTRYDFYWPSLAHLGEQAVYNSEIFWQNAAADDLVFGYQERWAEYRFKPSRLSGLFRSDAVGSLDAWHLSQDFTSLPVLNASFIEDNPPLDRVVAVPSEPHFIFDGYFRLNCARPMPVYSIPGFIDHF